MNATEVLERCRAAQGEIASLQNRIERYRDSAASVTHFADGVGGGKSTGEPDKMLAFVAEIAALEEQKALRARQYSAELAASLKLLDMLPEMESRVLHLFYVKNIGLSVIAAEQNYSYGYIRKVKAEGLRQARLISARAVREVLPTWYLKALYSENNQ